MSEIDDLVAELNQKTEENSSSFEEAPKAEVKEEDFTAPPPEPERPKEEEPKNEPPPYTGYDARKQAEGYIRIFNKLQKPGLTWTYGQLILNAGDVDALSALQKRKDLEAGFTLDQACQENDQLYAILQRFDRYAQAVEKVSLTEEEIESIIEPLTAVIQKYRWMQLGPEAMLVITVALVMLPRLEPLLPRIDWSSIFNAK